MKMDQFELLLSMRRLQCEEVPAVEANEAAKFNCVSVVRGISFSYSVTELQKQQFEMSKTAHWTQYQNQIRPDNLKVPHIYLDLCFPNSAKNPLSDIHLVKLLK